LGKAEHADDALNIDLAGLKLRNPTLLASGFLGISQDIFNRLYSAGIGAVVTKSISIDPREGYRNPTVVAVAEESYLNAVGLANPGADAFSKEIEYNVNVPIIVSLVGSDSNDFPPIIKKFDRLNILGYEINLSCPHVAKLGTEVGDDPKMVEQIVKTAKSITHKPLIVKVGIGNSDVVNIAKVAKDSGADAVTAINTIRAMVINVEDGIPILSNRVGGLSGRSIKPIGVRCVYEIFKKIEIPVIGCGGIFTWEDAVEYILAGASAIQLGSVIGYRGISAFRDITLGVSKYLKKKGLGNVKELVGLAHKY
jgi:dihydroorotate dehydrogenase (NAD+) catalytic subunit